MNDFSLKRSSELIRGVIELLWTRPDGLTGSEVIVRLPEIVKLTEYETGLSSSSNSPRYAQAVRLATLPLVKAGWLMKTDKGEMVYHGRWPRCLPEIFHAPGSVFRGFAVV